MLVTSLMTKQNITRSKAPLRAHNVGLPCYMMQDPLLCTDPGSLCTVTCSTLAHVSNATHIHAHTSSTGSPGIGSASEAHAANMRLAGKTQTLRCPSNGSQAAQHPTKMQSALPPSSQLPNPLPNPSGLWCKDAHGMNQHST